MSQNDSLVANLPAKIKNLLNVAQNSLKMEIEVFP